MPVGETVEFELVAPDGERFPLNVLTDKDGNPRWDIASASNEAADRGQRGTIKILDQSGGSGQKVARDFRRYLLANGWLADRRGTLIPRGPRTDVVLESSNSAIVAAATRRGAIFSVVDQPYVMITPLEVYEDITTPVAKKAPGPGCVFTGSYARFGNRVFMGAENAETADGCTAAVRIAAGNVVPIDVEPLDSGNSTTVQAAVVARKLESGDGGAVAQAPVQTKLTTTDLNSGSTATSYATMSYTPGANVLLLATVVNVGLAGAAGAVPSGLAGNTLTWTKIADVLAGRSRLSLWYAYGSGTAGALTISFASAQASCIGSVSQLTNVASASQIVQSATKQSGRNAAGLTVTLPSAFTNPGNVTFGAFARGVGVGGSGGSAGNLSSPSDWTQITEVRPVGVNTDMLTEWKSSPDTTVEVNGSVFTGDIYTSGIAIEIAVGTGSTNVFHTQPFKPTGNCLVLAAVLSYIAGGAPAAPSSLSGNGITWTSEKSLQFDTNQRRITVYRGLVASPTEGQLTISFAANQDACSWAIAEFANVDTTGTAGSGATVQSPTNTGSSTTPSVTMAAFGNANNATVGLFGSASGAGFTAGSGFTELHKVLESGGLFTEWKATNDTSVDCTLAESAPWGAIGIEVKASLPTAAYSTGTVSPTEGRLVVLGVHSYISGGSPAAPTPAGCNLTWTQQQTVALSNRRLTVFTAPATNPQDGIISLNFAGVTQTNVSWTVFEVLNTDLNNTPVVQGNTNSSASATSLTVTLSAFADANDGAIGVFWRSGQQEIVPGSGFEEIHDISAGDGRLFSEFIAVEDTTVDASGAGDASPVAFDAASEYPDGAGSATSHTWTHTCNGNYLLVGLGLGDTVDRITAVTANGTPMTRLGSVKTGPTGLAPYNFLYGLPAPPTGSVTILVSLSASRNLQGGAVSFSGVDSVTAATTATGTSTTPSLAITTTAGEIAFATLGFNPNTALPSPGAGETERYESVSSGASASEAGYTETATGASTTIAPTLAGGGTPSWGIIGVSIRPGVAATWLGAALELRRTASAAGDYADAGFQANYLATVGSRLFRLRYDAAQQLWYESWTDELGTNTPAFHTEYPVTGAKRSTADLRTVGPNPVAGISGIDQAAEFLAIDTEGSFTPLIQEGMGISNIVAGGAFLQGQVFLLSGSAKALWFRQLLDVAVLDLEAVPLDDSLNARINSDVGGVGAFGQQLWVGLDNQILQGVLSSEGWAVNHFESLDSTFTILAVRAWPDAGQLKVDVLLRAVNYVAGATDAIIVRTYQIYDGQSFPTPDSDTKIFRSSIYEGEHWVTKKFQRVRGYLHNDTAEALTVDLVVDGTVNALGTVTSTGPFALDVATTALGRGCYARLTCGALMGVVELPLEVDYFYHPQEDDLLQIPVVVGRDTMNRGGTVSKESRQLIEDKIRTRVRPEASAPWTLNLWDDRSWSVIPLRFETKPLYPEAQPSGDGAIEWLVLQRV